MLLRICNEVNFCIIIRLRIGEGYPLLHFYFSFNILSIDELKSSIFLLLF